MQFACVEGEREVCVNKAVWRSVNCRRGIRGGNRTLSLIPSSNLAAAGAHTEKLFQSPHCQPSPHRFWALQTAKKCEAWVVCVCCVLCQLIRLWSWKLVFKINFLMLQRTKQQICYLKQPSYQLNYQMRMAYWSNSGKKPELLLKKQAVHLKDLYSSHSRTVHKQYGCSQLCWLPWFLSHWQCQKDLL